MYVCVCIYIYIYIGKGECQRARKQFTIAHMYIYIYTHTHTHIYTHIYTHMYVYISICVYMCLCVCVGRYTCRSQNSPRQRLIHIHDIQTYIHTYRSPRSALTKSDIHTNIHTHIQVTKIRLDKDRRQLNKFEERKKPLEHSTEETHDGPATALVRVCMYVHAYIRMYVCTYTHIHIHTQALTTDTSIVNTILMRSCLLIPHT
jgi:hypothetical protein